MQNTIIVPYRDRQLHLNKFAPYMFNMLKCPIVIVEQADGKPFNRGKLLNIGVLEFESDYYSLHDVDMLPVKSDYSFPEQPTLLAMKAQQFGYKMPYAEYFGGVVLISREHMVKVNGYHNEYWGWGGEDDDFRKRVIKNGLMPSHRECTYNSLPHPRKICPVLHKKNCDLLKVGDPSNGLTNCEYTVIKRELFTHYTKITVEI